MSHLAIDVIDLILSLILTVSLTSDMRVVVFGDRVACFSRLQPIANPDCDA